MRMNTELAIIGERLRTQDNRMTSYPLYVVFQKRRIYSDQGELFEWVEEDGWEPATEDEVKELDALDDDFKEAVLNGVKFLKSHYVEVDEFVTGCFTEVGAKDYLEANGHNLERPHIYATSLYRNSEMIGIREWLMAETTSA